MLPTLLFMWGLGDISCENGNIPFLSLYIFDIAVVYIKIYVFSMLVHLSVKYDEELNRLGSVSVEMSRTGTRSYSGFRVILVCLLPFYFPTVCCRSWLDILIVIAIFATFLCLVVAGIATKGISCSSYFRSTKYQCKLECTVFPETICRSIG